MTTCHHCGASLSPAIGWCGQCYTTSAPYRRSVVPTTATRAAGIRRTATTFGLVGRAVITIAVLGVGVAGLAATASWTDAVGRAGGGLAFLFMALWAVVAIPVLWSTWRPGRGSRIVYVDGPLVLVTPARRRADDPMGSPR